MSLFHNLNFEPLSHSFATHLEEELAVLENEIEEFLHVPHVTTTIENGHLLPTPIRRKIKPQSTGVALKEISTKYKTNDTFVVIGRGSRILYRFGDASGHSKCHEGGWRGQAISILTHGVFNYFMILAVLLNCILYAVIPYEPTAPSDGVPEERGIDSQPTSQPASSPGILAKVNCYGFLILYILEFGLKLFARGVWGKRNPFSCLRISWSWLDVFVIIVGVLSILIPSDRTLAALNGFRALKLIPLIPSWLGGYDRMFRRTWKRLLRVGVFAAIVLFLLSLMASEMFFNTLRQKCVLNTTAVASYKSGEPLKKDSFLLNPRGEAYYLPCGNSSVSEVCPADYVCLIAGENPQDGHVGFDSLPISAFSLLNVLFQDYAELVFEGIWAIHGPFHIIYFILVFFLGTFSIGALVYSVLGYEFEKGFVATLAAEKDPENIRERNARDCERIYHVAQANIFEKTRENGKKLVSHDYFDIGITIFIILDVVNFGLDHYGIQENTPVWTFFYLVNQVVYVVYCLEFLLKVSFLGVKTYWKKPWNRFDFFVVVLIVFQSFLEGGLMSYRVTTSVLKIVPRWPVLQLMLTIMIKTTWIWFRWAFGLNGVLLFTFSYVGYVAFGSNYKENADAFPDSKIPRWNTVDFWHSAHLMFRSFSGEWIETTWDLLLVSPVPGALLLMIPSGIIGNFLGTCLGVSIILTTTHLLGQSEASDEPERELTSLERIFHPCSLLCSKVKSWTASQETDSAVEGPEEGKFKKFAGTLQKMLDHVAYRHISCFLIILVSILVMYWEFPTEIFFVVYFGIELILHLVAIGLSRKLLNVGLIFDALMILNSILALSLDLHQGVGQLGSFRLFMLVSRISGLVIVRDEFWSQLSAIYQYLLASLFIWYTFALGGMSLFSGKFSKCFDKGEAIDPATIPGKVECIAANKTWENDEHFNFDSVPDAFLTLVTIATRNGWISALTSAENSNGRDMQPGRELSPAAILYFVAFLLIGVLFPLYTIFGVIWHGFKTKSWADLFPNKDKESETNGKNEKSQTSDSFLSKFVNHDYFEVIVCLIILIDASVVAVQFSMDEDVDPETFEALRILRMVILVLYIVELGIRGFALQKSFVKKWVNHLLLVVVIVSIIEFFIDDLGDAVNYFLILRTFRLLHIVSLDKIGQWTLPEFTSYRKGLLTSFPSLAYLLLFYIITFSSYAVFGSVAFEGTVDFSSWKAMTSLFKIGTISGWDGIWQRISVGGDCKVESEGDCGHPTLGLFFALTFILLTVFVFLNIYFVLIREIVNQLKKCEEDTVTRGDENCKTAEPKDEEQVNVVDGVA